MNDSWRERETLLLLPFHIGKQQMTTKRTSFKECYYPHTVAASSSPRSNEQSIDNKDSLEAAITIQIFQSYKNYSYYIYIIVFHSRSFHTTTNCNQKPLAIQLHSWLVVWDCTKGYLSELGIVNMPGERY